MANLIYRQPSVASVPSTTVKNAPLSNIEVDTNFKNLDDDIQTRATTTALQTVADNAIALSIALG